jgi:hypothetical protein
MSKANNNLIRRGKKPIYNLKIELPTTEDCEKLIKSDQNLRGKRNASSFRSGGFEPDSNNQVNTKGHGKNQYQKQTINVHGHGQRVLSEKVFEDGIHVLGR